MYFFSSIKEREKITMSFVSLRYSFLLSRTVRKFFPSLLDDDFECIWLEALADLIGIVLADVENSKLPIHYFV